MDVTVGAYNADQLGWQGSSSSLDGHRMRGGGKEFKGDGDVRGQEVPYDRSRKMVMGYTDSDSEGCRPQG